MNNERLQAESEPQTIEHRLRQANIAAIANSPCYSGYPKDRLVIQDEDLSVWELTLEEGPWSTENSQLPSTEEQTILSSSGYQLDQKGRPLHPWLYDMLTTPDVGVVTNKGKFYKWGPNYTGDPIIITREPIPRIALVQRKDNGLWALPGGFVDQADGTDPVIAGINASRREAFEEIGIDVRGEVEVIYQGPVADPRATAHAWPETTGVLWRIDQAEQLTPDFQEVDDAVWFPINQLPDTLHGSHGILIDEALCRL